MPKADVLVLYKSSNGVKQSGQLFSVAIVSCAQGHVSSQPTRLHRSRGHLLAVSGGEDNPHCYNLLLTTYTMRRQSMPIHTN